MARVLKPSLRLRGTSDASESLQARDEALAGRLANALAPWFEAHARALSFRGTPDPYRVWVSEVMLQQTRVESVERFFAPFIDRFPSVESLASSSEDAVLAAWSGLGYYRRARLLHAGARYVNEHLGGTLPRSTRELREIPGIGPYTAGAIASIAYGEPEPLVDGNVARVLSRLCGVTEVAAQGAGTARHWAIVRSVLSKGDPRVLAQALMELGATVCTPGTPSCVRCPVVDVCEARRAGQEHLIPEPRVRNSQAVEHFVAIMIRGQQGLLLERRPADGLLSGMWTPPLVPVDRLDVATNRPAAQRGLQSLLATRSRRLVTAAQWIEDGAGSAAQVEHVFTHRRWRLHMLGLTLPIEPTAELAAGSSYRWWNGEQRGQEMGGIPTLTRRLAEAATLALPRSEVRPSPS